MTWKQNVLFVDILLQFIEYNTLNTPVNNQVAGGGKTDHVHSFLSILSKVFIYIFDMFNAVIHDTCGLNFMCSTVNGFRQIIKVKDHEIVCRWSIQGQRWTIQAY